MSKKVFVDTGAFLALTNRADQHHQNALNCLGNLQIQRVVFVTSNFILDETYTRLRSKAGLNAAIRFGEEIQLNRQLKIVTVEKSLETIAWEIFKKYHEQYFSYTDCTSFAIMKRKKLKEAFSFDKDFKIFGWTTHPS